MVIASFLSGPATVGTNDEGFNFMKIKKDFEEQYRQIKGKAHQTYRVKKSLIGEIQEVFTQQ